MKKSILSLLLCLLSAALMATDPTGTLPIVYMRTTSGQPITDKENYVPGTVYIDPLSTGYAALGSSAAPIAAQLKGRGNWTWTGFDKKPYKIKFDAKQKVLGMAKNKHWVLLAAADDCLGGLKNPVGFMLSRALGLRWTPGLVPVELVLNGQYQGIYYLTEHVRVAKDRVNIAELPDNTSSADSITGGWLVEIDNYSSENNITFNEGNGQYVMVSLREPEILSAPQRLYIEQQIFSLNNVLYGHSATQLKQMIDIEEAAKYYLVQEIMEDCESYHGSCMLYKDRDSLGIADPWKFGPVWDFGNAYDRHAERFIYDGPIFAQYWIGQLASWPVFQQAVQEQWWVFYHQHKAAVRTQIQSFAAQIESAMQRDADVWRGTQNYCDNSNFTDVRDRFLRRYDWRTNWLYEQWGEGIRPVSWDIEQTPVAAPQTQKIFRNGQILILRNGETYTLTGHKLTTDN